jgi:hypothetical protein
MILFYLSLYCVLFGTTSALHLLHANVAAWGEVVKQTKAHAHLANYAEPELAETELVAVFNRVWAELRVACPTIPEHHDVSVGFDDRLLDPNDEDYANVLGYAYATEMLSEGVWSSVLSSQQKRDVATGQGATPLGVLRVAREIPGGWYRGDGACLYKFRLEDVLRHEILHLVGISSSVRKGVDGSLYVGTEYAGLCFPGAFDRAIRNKNGEQVVGTSCEFTAQLGGEPLYVNGVQLYQYEGDFLQGTSISHLRSLDAMMTPSIGHCMPDGDKPLTTLDGSVLASLGIVCDDSMLVKATERFRNPDFLAGSPDEPNPIVGGSDPTVGAPTHSPSPGTGQTDDSNPQGVPIQRSSQNSVHRATESPQRQLAPAALLVALVSAMLAYPI